MVLFSVSVKGSSNVSFAGLLAPWEGEPPAGWKCKGKSSEIIFKIEEIRFVCFVKRSQLPGLLGRERQGDGLFEICFQLSLRNELRNEICLCRISIERISLFHSGFCAEGFGGFKLCDDPGVGAEGHTNRKGRRKFFKVFSNFRRILLEIVCFFSENFNSTCLSKMKACLSLEATSRRSIAQIEVESQQQVIKGSEV